ncbi:hypothetical protein [Aeromonas media]|uniref:hypothetical protein n=1 Tax=Aeromonas media TaxID=651 RepID=UPI001F3FCBDF|nr:hypothetical protein [Aeromonas media]
MKLINKISLILTCALLAACSTSQPIRNMAANPVPFNLTEEQVAKAIITAGREHTSFVFRPSGVRR